MSQFYRHEYIYLCVGRVFLGLCVYFLSLSVYPRVSLRSFCIVTYIYICIPGNKNPRVQRTHIRIRMFWNTMSEQSEVLKYFFWRSDRTDWFWRIISNTNRTNDDLPINCDTLVHLTFPLFIYTFSSRMVSNFEFTNPLGADFFHRQEFVCVRRSM